jgi:hypothetical protein
MKDWQTSINSTKSSQPHQKTVRIASNEYRMVTSPLEGEGPNSSLENPLSALDGPNTHPSVMGSRNSNDGGLYKKVGLRTVINR